MSTVMTGNPAIDKILVSIFSSAIMILLGLLSFLGLQAVDIGKSMLSVQEKLQVETAKTNTKLDHTILEVTDIKRNQVKQQDQIEQIRVEVIKNGTELTLKRHEPHYKQNR